MFVVAVVHCGCGRTNGRPHLCERLHLGVQGSRLHLRHIPLKLVLEMLVFVALQDVSASAWVEREVRGDRHVRLNHRKKERGCALEQRPWTDTM